MKFAVGEADHVLFMEADGNRLTRTHAGSLTRGPIKGSIDGDKVAFQSVLRAEGSRLGYRFSGRVDGDRMEGDLDLGEYPNGTWTAVRHVQGAALPRDPVKSGKTG